MTYAKLDIFNRIKATLPGKWFGEQTPVLDSVLRSLSQGWISLLGLLDYSVTQTRMTTASDIWLDLISCDYFNRRLRRRQRETDDSFRSRISKELLRDRCTRPALNDLLCDLTGQAPIIFEPTNPRDTGCYGSTALLGVSVSGYGASGGWGNLGLPFQVFIRAFLAETAGIAMVNGWGGSIGGFGIGLSTYIGSGMNSSRPDDSEIYQNVCRTVCAGTIVWMSITP